MQQVNNVIFATILSFLVIFGWNMWFGQTEQSDYQKKEAKTKQKEYLNTRDFLGTQNIEIKTSKLHGFINLKGGKINFLELLNYRSDDRKKNALLLKPQNTKNAYFIDFEWISQGNFDTPNHNTVWNYENKTLTSKTPVVLFWQNDQDVVFKIKISVDQDYMFTVEKEVINNSSIDIDIACKTNINRVFEELEKGMLIMHEGPVGVVKDQPLEIKYKDVIKKNLKFTLDDLEKQKKWLGFSDKYWLVSQIFGNTNQEQKLNLTHLLDSNDDHVFKISNISPSLIIKSGSKVLKKDYIFAGPKELKVLENYERSMDIAFFTRSVDFGILYFVTRPIFTLLQFFYQLVGNFGVAIILLTLFVRMIMLPLSIKSCASMIKIKDLQPEIAKIKKIYAEDKESLNKESISLFKKHNVTPMSGCMPTLLQVPVFFALYKVLFITIEMRQAEFFWWIKDLSAPDPTNVFNLFGLLNWQPPLVLSIGVLPIILGITVSVQQKLTSAKYEDTMQSFMAKSMPYIFVVLFASFPSGLVLYWIFNNIISIAQQLIVKKYLTYKSSFKKI